jgi:hypothetical protein
VQNPLRGSCGTEGVEPLAQDRWPATRSTSTRSSASLSSSPESPIGIWG